MKIARNFSIAVCLLFLTANVSFAQTWAEVGDAGSLPGSAQSVITGGGLTTITGNLTANDVDMFRFSITSPTTFSASTAGFFGMGFEAIDTQLFLFSVGGLGIASNDDTNVNLRAVLPAGNPLLTVLAPGDYLIAVTTYDVEPVDANGQLIFPNSNFVGVFGPTVPGGGLPVAGYVGNTFAAAGLYHISFTGAAQLGGVSAAPEPASVTMFCLGGLGILGFGRRGWLKRRQ